MSKEGSSLGIEKMKMPQLGESVTEGTISKWLVSPGDTVNKYDPIAEVQTDKVNAEVPSSFTGVIKELLAEEGDTLEVGEIICSIELEGRHDAPAEEKRAKRKKPQLRLHLLQRTQAIKADILLPS